MAFAPQPRFAPGERVRVEAQGMVAAVIHDWIVVILDGEPPTTMLALRGQLTSLEPTLEEHLDDYERRTRK